MKKLLFAFLFVGVTGTAHATWTDFYMMTNGSNTSSGFTADPVAPVASTNGSWAQGANTARFIAASGTPFTSTKVGQWASICYDSSTVAVFIASITAVVSNTTIDVATTSGSNFLGVIPIPSATTRTCKVGGAWADRNLIAQLFASKAVPCSMRVNIQTGTYSNTGNTITFGASGGNGNLLWWRGYKTTPGDEDNNGSAVPGTDIPLFTFTSGEFSATGANQIFSAIASSCSATVAAGGCIDAHGANQSYIRVQAYSSNPTANATALVQNSAANNLLVQSCYIQASSAATNALQCNGSNNCYAIGSTVVGASITASVNGAGTVFYENYIYGSFWNGMNVGTTGGISIINNTIYQPPNDAIHINAASVQGTLIVNNHIENASGVGAAAINLLVSTNSLHISGNAYFNNTLNISTEVLEGFAPFDNPTLAQSALTNPNAQNFLLKPNGFNLGYPNVMEGLPFPLNSYVDVGATQGARDSSFTFGN